MSTLLIEGGNCLQGTVAVEGNKNAALPLLAACLLTGDECVLTNVPRIGDVEVMARLLLDIGAEVEGIGTTTLKVRAPNVRSHMPDRTLVGRVRASVLLLCKGMVAPMAALPSEYVSERIRARAIASLGGPAHANDSA